MAGQLTIDTLRAGSGVLATQNGMTGIAKAWVQWTGGGTTINASFNVSSITRNATGNYSIAYTTSMPSSNYVVVCGSDDVGNSRGCFGFLDNAATAPTTSGCRVQFSTVAVNTFSDPGIGQLTVFSA